MKITIVCFTAALMASTLCHAVHLSEIGERSDDLANDDQEVLA